MRTILLLTFRTMLGLALPALSDLIEVQAETRQTVLCNGSFHLAAAAEQSASVTDFEAGSHPTAGAMRQASASDFAAEKQLYLDEYASQVACWSNASKDPDALASDETADATAAPGEGGAWLSILWLELRGEWEKIQVATQETWEPSKQSFEEKWSAFTKAHADASPPE